MDIIELGNSSIILMLDRQEKYKYSIDSSTDDPSLRNGFVRLVSDMGLNKYYLSGALVQIFDSINGGCEMFITKLSENEDQKKEKTYIYMFSSVNDLISASKMITVSGGTDGKISLDKKQRKYYLETDREYKNICEFNGKTCKNEIQGYISEHCTHLSKTNLSSLAALD